MKGKMMTEKREKTPLVTSNKQKAACLLAASVREDSFPKLLELCSGKRQAARYAILPANKGNRPCSSHSDCANPILCCCHPVAWFYSFGLISISAPETLNADTVTTNNVSVC